MDAKTEVQPPNQEEVKQGDKKMPIDVEYCPNCGLPPEYCEYGQKSVLDKCLPYLQEKHPEIYTRITAAKTEEKAPEAAAPQEEQKAGEQPANAEEKKTNEEVKEPKESKPKKVAIKEEKKVTITTQKRTNKKFLTVIAGLDSYGIVLKDAAKKFGKKFACGSSVVALADRSTIEIQGDIAAEIVEYITKEFPEIPERVIQIKEK
eukprot:TRINITY_DN525_c0_g1_i1.p1 TRINITY_DN525_c0_g1~~TRINITY_DN525_c0_g1_i1.p1  ORF type:complete len:205 (-),score=79.42 TRINITY_DN525_c0_g1_i1:198-812(-)